MTIINENIKAFIYDMGGVVMKYTSNETANFVQTEENIFGEHLENLEIGKLSLAEFFETVSEENPAKRLVEKAKNSQESTDIMSNIFVKDENIEKSIKILAKNGYKIVLLTNNFYIDKNRLRTTIISDLSDFDVVVESCKVGMRKPNKDIYEYTLSLLNLKPFEAIFLDDLQNNCNGAESIGLKTIQVKTNKSEDAVREIEKLTGLSIL